MAARIHQRGRIVRASPRVVLKRPRGQIVGVVPLHVGDGAQNTSVDHGVNLLMQRHEPHLMDDRDDAVRYGFRRRNTTNSIHRIGERLLAKHVKPMGERVDDVTRVRAIGCADDDGVQIRPELVEAPAPDGLGRAEGSPREPLGLWIEHLHDAASRDARHVERVRLPSAAEPEDANTQRRPGHGAAARSRTRSFIAESGPPGTTEARRPPERRGR